MKAKERHCFSSRSLKFTEESEQAVSGGVTPALRSPCAWFFLLPAPSHHVTIVSLTGSCLTEGGAVPPSYPQHLAGRSHMAASQCIFLAQWMNDLGLTSPAKLTVPRGQGSHQMVVCSNFPEQVLGVYSSCLIKPCLSDGDSQPKGAERTQPPGGPSQSSGTVLSRCAHL